MRVVLFALAAFVLGPLMLFGGAVAANALLGEWSDGIDLMNPFDFSDISWLDWIAGGPGATKNSFEHYVTLMIGGMLCIGSFTTLRALWTWARPEQGHAA